MTRSGQRPDLIVVGAGVMGSWTAFWANRAGLRTTLLDAWGPGNPRATSADETRVSRAAHGDDAYYLRWSRSARELWRRFGTEWGEELFIQTGLLWLARREGGFEDASWRVLLAESVPSERLTPGEVKARWPQTRVDDLAFAIYEPEAGVVLARNAVRRTVRAFESEGGLHELAEVRPRIAGKGRMVEVVDGSGRRWTAGTFVFACGPWLPRLFPAELATLIRVTKQDVFFMGTPPADPRWLPGRFPTWADYDRAIYGLPAIDGRALKTAPDRYGPVFDPTSGERIVDPDSAWQLRRFVGHRFPDLAGQPIVETRVCQYETTPDTHFIIDRHPSFENVWIVGGGSGHGFKHGPRLGEYVVSRLQGTPVGPDEARFAIGPREPRLGVRAGGDSMASAWDDP